MDVVRPLRAFVRINKVSSIPETHSVFLECCWDQKILKSTAVQVQCACAEWKSPEETLLAKFTRIAGQSYPLAIKLFNDSQNEIGCFEFDVASVPPPLDQPSTLTQAVISKGIEAIFSVEFSSLRSTHHSSSDSKPKKRRSSKVASETDSPTSRKTEKPELIFRTSEGGQLARASSRKKQVSKRSSLDPSATRNRKSNRDPDAEAFINNLQKANLKNSISRNPYSLPSFPLDASPSKEQIPTLDATNNKPRVVTRIKGHRKAASESSSTDVADMRLKYAQNRTKAATEFLLTIIASDDYDHAVKATVVVKAVGFWAGDNPELIPLVISACNKKLEASTSRAQILSMLSTMTCVWYFSRLEASNSKIVRQQNIHEKLCEKSRPTISKSFDALWGLLFNLVDKQLQSYLASALHLHDSQNLKSIDTLSLADVKKQISDFVAGVLRCPALPVIKETFFKRLYRWILNSMLRALLESSSIHFNQGLQLKLLMTSFIEWSESFGFSKLAATELTPAREVANLICFSHKAELTHPSEKQTICPSLRPSFLATILSKYQPSQDQEEKIPTNVIQTLRSQEKEFQADDSTYEHQETGFKGLDVTFELCSFMETFVVTIPKCVKEFPGFEFMREQQNQVESSTNNDINESNEQSGEGW